MHRVTHYLASTDRECLGQDLRAFVDGQNLSAKLRTEITAYQLCVLDDSMQEGPHAYVSKAAASSCNSAPAWWSATIRFKQNMRVRSDLGVRFQWFMNRWKSIGQSSAWKRRRGIRLKKSPHVVRAMVYRTGQHCNVDRHGLAVKLPGSGPDLAIDLTDNEKIVQDFVRKVFTQGNTFTLPADGHLALVNALGEQSEPQSSQDRGQPGQCFSVVGTDLLVKKHVVTEKIRSLRLLSVPALVQNFTFWHAGVPGQRNPDVYLDGPPELLDLVSLSSFTNLTSRAVHWEMSASDVQGCMTLQMPMPVMQRQWYHRAML